VGDGPHGVRFGPDGQKAYVTVTTQDKVVVIDAKQHEVAEGISNPGFPFWLAIQKK
jgi:YVTN family beta-propeller protein